MKELQEGCEFSKFVDRFKNIITQFDVMLERTGAANFTINNPQAYDSQKDAEDLMDTAYYFFSEL